MRMTTRSATDLAMRACGMWNVLGTEFGSAHDCETHVWRLGSLKSAATVILDTLLILGVLDRTLRAFVVG